MSRLRQSADRADAIASSSAAAKKIQLTPFAIRARLAKELAERWVGA
jgi:hypothetical protein